jgi:hypothetical protein
MNRESEKVARNETGAGPVVVDLRERVPLLDDKALATLHTNAMRLKDGGGSARQRASAEDLLPVIEGELAARREKKRAEAPPKPPRATKKKKKPAAEKAPAEETEG